MGQSSSSSPKNSDIIVIKNNDGELFPTRHTTVWRVCIDYEKLNSVTKKGYSSFLFINQILKTLTSQSFYYFLDRYSRYNQIHIYPEDLEKSPLHAHYEHLPIG